MIPNTIIKLHICIQNVVLLPFITKITTLRELKLSFYSYEDYIGFEKLQHIFPQLEILKIPDVYPRRELLIKYFET